MRVRCSYCRRYLDKKDAITLGIQRFCSEEHYLQYRGDIKSKSASKSAEKSKVPDEVRAAVVQRDLGRCRFPNCGETHGVEAHHIKYRSEGGGHEVDNLISLCRDHHVIVHSDKKVYQKMCFEIIGVDHGS
ncbi:MAG: HNH endonuclease [Micrococcales bacterium]|nr:HNH endonuclease [Micrococcales bacterium]